MKLIPCLKCQKAKLRKVGHAPGAICPLDSPINLSTKSDFDIDLRDDQASKKALEDSIEKTISEVLRLGYARNGFFPSTFSDEEINGYILEETWINDSDNLGENYIGPSFEKRYIKDQGDGTAEIIEVIIGIECNPDWIESQLGEGAFEKGEFQSWDGEAMWITEQVNVCEAEDDGYGGWEILDFKVDDISPLGYKAQKNYEETLREAIGYALSDDREFFSTV